MIAIVDYGVGNLFSLVSSFRYIGSDITVTGDRDAILRADRIVLPGVGAFGDAADKLRATGLDAVLKSEAAAGKPLLGICLGMQLLLDCSFEFGEHAGLGLIHGSVKPIAPLVGGLKVPHIGWNSLSFPENKPRHPLFSGLGETPYVYFVHSFAAMDCDSSVIARTEYLAPLTAAVADRNVMGTQFHPEKSGEVGLDILRSFCEI